MEQKYLIGLQIKGNNQRAGVYGVLSTDNGTDGGIFGLFFGRNDTYVTSHDFNTAQITVERTVFVEDKALRTNTNPDLLVRNISCLKNGILSYL